MQRDYYGAKYLLAMKSIPPELKNRTGDVLRRQIHLSNAANTLRRSCRFFLLESHCDLISGKVREPKELRELFGSTIFLK